jgi:hypothetical protein
MAPLCHRTLFCADADITQSPPALKACLPAKRTGQVGALAFGEQQAGPEAIPIIA